LHGGAECGDVDRIAKHYPVVPALLSADLERAAAFYGGLGFAEERLAGEDRAPQRIGVARDGLYLPFFDEPVGAVTTPVMSGTLYSGSP
jgi:hypothetical protein